MSVCLSVCGHSDVRLTSPPVLMLCGTQGYLWLSYDLTEANWTKIWAKKIFFFQKNTLLLRQLKVAILKFSLIYLINNVHTAASGIQLPLPLKPAASSNLFIYRLEEVAVFRKLPLPLMYLSSGSNLEEVAAASVWAFK